MTCRAAAPSPELLPVVLEELVGLGVVVHYGDPRLLEAGQHRQVQL